MNCKTIESDQMTTNRMETRFVNNGKAVPSARAEKTFSAIAAVASALCWGAIAAETDSASDAPVPIGVVLGGKTVREACYEGPGVRTVKADQVSMSATHRVQDVVPALPR